MDISNKLGEEVLSCKYEEIISVFFVVSILHHKDSMLVHDECSQL